MVSIQSTVIEIYRENKQISLSDLKEKFPTYASGTLSSALSVARRAISDGSGMDQKFIKITEEEIEKLIVTKLNKSLDNANIRLAIDFLKIKQKDHGLDTDLDITKFLKKVKDSKISAETDNSK